MTYPEIHLCMGILVSLGIISGILMESAGQYTRALIYAVLITITVDFQMQHADSATLLTTVFVISSVVLFLLRNQLSRVGTFMLLAMLVVSFVSTSGGRDSRYRISDDCPAGDTQLPIFLHIILDEQIGIEGIPREFDRNATYASELRDFYLDHGFQVFGRAYTRYDKTRLTLSRLFNFDSRGCFINSYCGSNKPRSYYLKSNEYFDLMRKRGYQIHVYQTRYFELCGDNSDEEFCTCFTYDTEGLQAIEGSALSIGSKIQTIFGVYARLSTILMDLKVPQIRLTAVSAMGILDELQEDLLRAQPGSLFLVHLLLPHHPYSYEANCRLRPDPASWLLKSDLTDPGGDDVLLRGKRKTRNTPESRAERYPIYLEQMACTHRKLGEMFAALEDAGRFQQMKVLIHGDHGSRISIRIPNVLISGLRIPKRDLLDSFSTLFAYKQPGMEPVYDRRILPIVPLFEAIIRDGSVPEGREWAGSQTVYFRNATKKSDEAQPIFNFKRELNEYDRSRALSATE